MIMQLHKNREKMVKDCVPSTSYQDRTRKSARRRRHQLPLPEHDEPHARMATTTITTIPRPRSNTSAPEDSETQVNHQQHRLPSTI